MLKKNQTSISQDIEEKILSMYAKGMTTGDIEAHIQDIYGISVSGSTVSRIHRQESFPSPGNGGSGRWSPSTAMVFLDTIHYHVRSEGQIVKKAVYAAVDEQAASDTLDVFAQRWEKNTRKSLSPGELTGPISAPISSILRRYGN